MLDDARMLATIAADLDRLDAVDLAGAGEPVTACPGWTVLDVLGHLGVIHGRLTGLVGGQPFALLVDQPPPPPADEVLAWRREMSRSAFDALSSVDPETPMPSWFGRTTARVWVRRMMHETAMHRWDIEAATGAPQPFEPDVAIDAVDELLEIFAPEIDHDAWASLSTEGSSSIHVHATDAAGEWVIDLSEIGLSFRREHAKGDVAARGPASDLALVIWNRRPATDLEVFGDEDLLARFLDMAVF